MRTTTTSSDLGRAFAAQATAQRLARFGGGGLGRNPAGAA
jgi:hypothetical protein